MPPKKTKAAAGGDDIDDLFEGIGGEAPAPKKSLEKKPKPTTAASKAMADQDILAELEKDLEQPSRPHTPRIKETAAKGPPRRSATPTIDDKAAAPRKSTDSARSLRASFTPSATSSDLQETEKTTASSSAAATAAPAAGGGWWGSVFSTASAAMKQAEAAVKEIQKNEEAKKWAEQVRGNVGGLRALGDNLRQQAMPTFTNILHTLAPPISSHERLLIHITHDMVGYPSLDPLIYGTFSRVMSQVEGGELMVIQRGQENTSRRYSNDGGAGWRDGPWWRQADSPRDLGMIKGLTEGTKLCRAGAEGYANEYFGAHGGLEQARIRATEPLSEENPVRSSDLFLAIQAVGTTSDSALFARTAAVEKEKEASAVADVDEADEMVCFAVFCLDPVHEIEYSAISQSIPARWIQWLDASNPLTPASGEDGQASLNQSIPDEIREIVEGGGVDPREWVAEWIEELLGLAVGVVAQRYVARRMGVGEGGIGKGKRRMDELVEDGGGEAARAGLI
ncbi:Maintenance of telomere capping protein 1 [Colletotrichum siamense]|uniref:Maintenance of telomere capping protein 1 n=1 Tax=Colletotrichum siamense TaxID=690259 RepID=A0A9P5K6P0_COLSI|nr:Maintenance of telomere capping protein 1 [Colletotrichum siamense]KAF4847802.1 Maintenance of telomere capping protein 1 [Colletotrichum siamense]KAF4861032.1 Maintenance of telomere capping protein 1 [Colletotrichum siamense]KAF5492192.1 Maintenance of telomere capping protein 1 [Colletotrichum siamense]KAI8262489.1 Maintenance of telomere capping protein 1 [Colletotrichum sp. SAR 10_77]